MICSPGSSDAVQRCVTPFPSSSHVCFVFSPPSFLKAYRVALAGNFLSGVISVILGVLGPQMLTIIPPAALLVPLAGVGFAFLGLEQAVASFSAPMVGFMVRWFRRRSLLYCRTIFIIPCYIAYGEKGDVWPLNQ